VDLTRLIWDDSVGIDELGAALDAADPEVRRTAARALDRADQRALYRKAKAASPLTLAHFVPGDRAPLEQVRHYGRNTLPTPGNLRLFEKRFCKPSDGSNRLFGYNESPFLGLIGPGFFVAVTTETHPSWVERGAVVIDYFQTPDGPVASGWPPVVPNTKGLQRFVYNKTRDFMRKVSTHVSIGAAYKVEKALDHYFILVRER
jgi:hypothetical protein